MSDPMYVILMWNQAGGGPELVFNGSLYSDEEEAVEEAQRLAVDAAPPHRRLHRA